MSQNPTNPTQTRDYFHTKVDNNNKNNNTSGLLDLGVLNVFPPKSQFIFFNDFPKVFPNPFPV